MRPMPRVQLERLFAVGRVRHYAEAVLLPVDHGLQADANEEFVLDDHDWDHDSPPSSKKLSGCVSVTTVPCPALERNWTP